LDVKIIGKDKKEITETLNNIFCGWVFICSL
jgi:hypothetical protein